MKKVFIILLMLVYGLSSSGMTISLHYCCGKLDDISFLARKDKSCKMGGHSKKSSCCNNKQISTKSHQHQELAAKWVQSLQTVVATTTLSQFFSPFTTTVISVDRLARGTPVPISTVPIFIKNCIFRI